LINQRQGGRRRGRGGQGGGGGRNLGGQPGNRQDNRQRGNAAQLLEKYKSLARDSQLAGDRVQTEYYLQYADHYFRVLGESRARFEDQNPRRQRDDESDEDDGDELEMAEADGDEERPERPERQERGERNERYSRSDRDNDRGQRRRYERNADDSADEARAPRGNGRDDSLPLDVLPPAIGADSAASLVTDEDDPAPAPRKRTRAPRRPSNGDDEVAPAA
jgi:hypothetical protein